MRTTDELRARAKAMRTQPTGPEARLWYHLRGKRLVGVKFVRQQPIGPFIADFVARTHRLVIELDGDTHADPSRDERRTAWLEQNGYRVIRFSNADVVSNETAVLETIIAMLRTAPLPNPLPAGGEREI